MTSTQITGGSIRYTVPSNFQSGKDGCEATIHFTVAEGADEALQAAIGDRARREAMRLATGVVTLQEHPSMGKTTASFDPAPATVALPKQNRGDILIGAPAVPPTPPSVPAASPSPSAAPQPTAPAAPAAPIVAASPPPPVSSAPSVSDVVIGAPTPAASTPPTPTAAPVVIGSAPVASTPSATNGSGPKEITDVDLRDAVQRYLARTDPGANADPIARQAGPVKVGALLTTFVPIPESGAQPKVYTLPQAMRQEFLTRLEALA